MLSRNGAGCVCLARYPSALAVRSSFPVHRVERAAWALFPLALTTLACGVGLTALGFYVYAARVEGRLYFGFGLLAGIFSAVAGGAGVAAARGSLDQSQAGGYVLTALLSALSAIGVLVGSYRAALDFPTYRVGAIGGAMSAVASIALAINLAGVALIIYAHVATAKTHHAPADVQHSAGDGASREASITGDKIDEDPCTAAPSTAK